MSHGSADFCARSEAHGHLVSVLGQILLCCDEMGPFSKTKQDTLREGICDVRSASGVLIGNPGFYLRRKEGN